MKMKGLTHNDHVPINVISLESTYILLQKYNQYYEFKFYFQGLLKINITLILAYNSIKNFINIVSIIICSLYEIIKFTCTCTFVKNNNVSSVCCQTLHGHVKTIKKEFN